MRVSVKIDPRITLGLTFAHGPNGPAVVKTVAAEGQLADKVSSQARFCTRACVRVRS